MVDIIEVDLYDGMCLYSKSRTMRVKTIVPIDYPHSANDFQKGLLRIPKGTVLTVKDVVKEKTSRSRVCNNLTPGYKLLCVYRKHKYNINPKDVVYYRKACRD